MPVDFPREHDKEARPAMHKLAKRTHTNAGWDKVVTETSPEAAFLVGIEGDEIPDDLARQLGLLETKDASTDGTEDKNAKRKKA